MALQEEITLVWDERVGGFTTFQTYVPDSGLSLNNKHFTFGRGGVYEHNSEDARRNEFYGDEAQPSEIDVIFNGAGTPFGPNVVKEFKTLAYEGTSGWNAAVSTDQESAITDAVNIPPIREISYDTDVFVNKEGKFFSEIKNNYTDFNTPDLSKISARGLGTADYDASVLTFNSPLDGDIRAQYQDPMTLILHRGDRIFLYQDNSADNDGSDIGTELIYAGEILSKNVVANTLTIGIPVDSSGSRSRITRRQVDNDGVATETYWENVSSEVRYVTFDGTDFEADTRLDGEPAWQQLAEIPTEAIPTVRAINDADFFILVKDEDIEDSGLKGFFSVVRMSINSLDKEELFSVSSNIFASSS